MSEGLECKEPRALFLVESPKYWHEPEERDSIGKAKEGGLRNVHLIAQLISGVGKVQEQTGL